jgi:hypothetical protein
VVKALFQGQFENATLPPLPSFETSPKARPYRLIAPVTNATGPRVSRAGASHYPDGENVPAFDYVEAWRRFRFG